MSRNNLLSIFQFILLLFLQVFLLNNINLFGFINPNLYLLFFIVSRFDTNPTLLVLLGFLMGLFLDLLTLGSGAHTIAALTIAFVRPIIIRTSFGINYDIPMGMIEGTQQNQRILYILMMIIFHHLLLYLIVYFSFNSVLIILKNTLFTSFFTFLMVYISLGLFKKGQSD
tara:strand:+ start:504 stop:1013 length:510 start_codon:yes stop_codon:yes gene_type:complete